MPPGAAARPMSRRRLTLTAYVRRRWRAIGAILVLSLGSLLVVAMTDRGHDPAWMETNGAVDQATLSPDASLAYVLLREDRNITGLEARDGLTGDVRWEAPVHSERALMAAGPSFVAIATEFPRAFLTVYNADGSPRWELPLAGSPTAMAVEDTRIVLALSAPSNPVIFFEDDLLLRTYHHPSPVRAVDAEAGLVATGGLQGEVMVYREREVLLNATLAMGVRSLRLAQDGTSVLVGGNAIAADDPRGLVAYLDIGGDEPVRWIKQMAEGVGLVDLDASALVAMAVEDEPPEATVHVLEGATGATRWTRRLPGSVQRLDAGDEGGAAISPDGNAVGVATLRGHFLLLDAQDGRERWSYRAEGAGVVAFGDDEPRRVLVAARLLENRPYDSILLFSLKAEPFVQRAALQAAVLLAVGATMLGLVVGLGYWRAKRPY